MKKTSRFLSLLLAAAMLLTMVPAASAEGAKYTTATTAEGWIKVVNEGGATLGYMPDSGVSLLEVDGYAFKDSNRNGTLDAYEDWRLDTDTRAADLAAQIPVDQIAGLMLLSTNGGRGQSLSDAWKADMQEGVRTYDGSAHALATAGEAEGGTIAVRTRGGEDLGAMTADEFIAKALVEIATKHRDN